MKKVILIFILFIFLINPDRSYCTDTVSAKYLPLAVGNVWVYNWIYFGYPSNGGTIKSRIVKDSIINSRKYYLCTIPALYPKLIRIDSVTGNVFGYYPGGVCSYQPNEILVDSLRSRKHDTTNFCSTLKRTCRDTGILNLFGTLFNKKEFDPVLALTASSRNYAKNLGIYYLDEGDPYLTKYYLKGCVINGVVYGDTSVPVGINKIGDLIPSTFSLHQNYPNPFNPLTKIKFAVPTPLNPPFSQRGEERSGGGFVTLTVYDILGREVAVLVNEQLKPGTYEVEFSATGGGTNYPSGVYFYKLAVYSSDHSKWSDEWTNTKRMVLLK
jgi:hypothetical protein